MAVSHPPNQDSETDMETSTTTQKIMPLQSAVALAYAIGDASPPRVVAKGKGFLAQAIIDRAKEAGIYVHSSPELVSLLMQVDLDKSIPPQLYVAVAELLAWLYRLEQNQAMDKVFLPLKQDKTV